MTGRENLEMVGAPVRAGPSPRADRGSLGARPARADRRRRPSRAHLLGWHAPPPRPRRQPGRLTRLLLLDEPTTGLDPRSRIDLWDAIRGLVAAGTDVLLTTQYLDEADQLAHDIVIIDHGTVIAAGTPAELKSQAGRDVIEVHVRDADALPPRRGALGRLGTSRRSTTRHPRVSVAVEAGTDRLTDARAAPRRARHRRRRHRAAAADPRRGVPRPHRPTRRHHSRHDPESAATRRGVNELERLP